jgi:hypothetical protein
MNHRLCFPFFILVSWFVVLPAKADPASASPISSPPASSLALEVNATDNELEPVQARWMNGATADEVGTDKRGVTQMFTWPSAKRLTAVGLKADDFDHKLNKGVIAPQDWLFEIHEIDAEGNVGTQVAALQFKLVPPNYKIGQYLVIKPTKPITLKSGNRYGFHLRPESVVDYQRLYFSRTARGAPQLGGVGNQTHGQALKRYSIAPGDYQYDLVFFLSHE